MQYKVCKCFKLYGKTYEPVGTTPATAGALSMFESSSAQMVATLKAMGVICDDETVGGLSTETKPMRDLCCGSSGGSDDDEDTLTQDSEGTALPIDPATNRQILPADTLTEDSNNVALPINPVTGRQTLPEIKNTTTTTNAAGTIHTIVTSDNVPTNVCANQYKGLRDNGEGSCTEEFLGQDGVLVEGKTFQLIPDTDQKLTNPVITQNTVDGVTTHTITWDVVDIDGNVIGQETATGIQMPVFLDKAGAPIAGPISPLLAAQFAVGTYAVGDKVMLLAADGSCKLVNIAIYTEKATGDPDNLGGPNTLQVGNETICEGVDTITELPKPTAYYDPNGVLLKKVKGPDGKTLYAEVVPEHTSDAVQVSHGLTVYPSYADTQPVNTLVQHVDPFIGMSVTLNNTTCRDMCVLANIHSAMLYVANVHALAVTKRTTVRFNGAAIPINNNQFDLGVGITPLAPDFPSVRFDRMNNGDRGYSESKIVGPGASLTVDTVEDVILFHTASNEVGYVDVISREGGSISLKGVTR